MMSKSRAPLIAMIAAGLALAVAGVAVVVTVTRGGGTAANAAAPVAPAAIAIDDGAIKAEDLAAVHTHLVEIVHAGDVGDLGVRFGSGFAALELQPTDVVVGISGRDIRTDQDVDRVLTELAVGDATAVYLELRRGAVPLLVRRTIDGGFRKAWIAAGGPPTASDPFKVTVPTMAGINKVDDTHYEVDRAVLDAELADPSGLGRGARIVPAVKNGKADGFKLYAIRPSSVFAALGLNNGDTLHSVNGFELTSADEALEAYAKIKTATSIELSLTRRGRDLSFYYTIR